MLLEEPLTGEPKRIVGPLHSCHLELQRADSQILRGAAQRLGHAISNGFHCHAAKLLLTLPGISNSAGKPNQMAGQACPDARGCNQPEKPAANGASAQ
jgi:hypothetical protein